MNFDEEFEEDICDLDDTKMCDSCGKCLEEECNDYMEIKIEAVIKENEEIYKEYEDFEVFHKEKEEERDYEFIEDHEKIREQYYKDMEAILKGKRDAK